MRGKVESRAKKGARQRRLWPFAMGLWLGVGVVALTTSWPYALIATLFAVCLHFAALDGP